MRVSKYSPLDFFQPKKRKSTWRMTFYPQINLLPTQIHCHGLTNTLTLTHSHSKHTHTHTNILTLTLSVTHTNSLTLTRDPFDAIWSEYQRRVSGSHVGGKTHLTFFCLFFTTVKSALSQFYIKISVK